MMKIKISNYEVLVKLYKRRQTAEMVSCFHCARSFLVERENMRVSNYCNSCK
jgi:hypothetical protein